MPTRSIATRSIVTLPTLCLGVARQDFAVYSDARLKINSMKLPLRLLATLSFAVALVACSKSPGPASSGGHVHTAPHGGTLVELGDHAYNMELVRDTSTGKLTAYILDGHASDFVRISAPSIELTTISSGQRRPLSLKAVANPATGETVGNTSQFEAQADWLKSGGELAGTIDSIEIKGSKFNNVALHLRK